MKDPLGLMGRETIFVMEFYYSRKEVEEFENMEAFKAGIVHKTHTLPYNYDGTGAVVYGPFLYYNRCVLIFEAGPSFSKRDLRNTRVTSLSTYGVDNFNKVQVLLNNTFQDIFIFTDQS